MILTHFASCGFDTYASEGVQGQVKLVDPGLKFAGSLWLHKRSSKVSASSKAATLQCPLTPRTDQPHAHRPFRGLDQNTIPLLTMAGVAE